MEDFVKLVLHIYLWFCVIDLIAYLPRIAFYLFAFKKQDRLVNHIKNKIAVIVPARNESAVIKDCLNSLATQTYDRDCFDTYIVIAEETDTTAQIAAAYERTYVTIIKNQSCKGDALDGVLKEILTMNPDGYDAFLLLDADNLAASDLLDEMNNALASGKWIICGKKLIKNWYAGRRHARSFIANCTALTYPQIDELGNRARNHFDMSITMIGTGMLVRSDVIKANNGWPYRGLTEDYEMTADAIIKGWSSMYYSHAKVYTEEALDAKTAYKRKMRWVKGYSQCQQRYFKSIIKSVFDGTIKQRNLFFLFDTYPAYAFFGVSAIVMIIGFIAACVSFFNNTTGLLSALSVVLIPFGLVYGVIFLYTLITLAADWRYINISMREKLAVLFFNPLYVLGYCRIVLNAFFTNYDYFKWEATRVRN